MRKPKTYLEGDGWISHHDRFYIHRVDGRGFLDNFYVISSVDSAAIQSLLKKGAAGEHNSLLDKLPPIDRVNDDFTMARMGEGVEVVRVDDSIVVLVHAPFTYKVMANLFHTDTMDICKLAPLLPTLLEDTKRLASGSKLVYDSFICDQIIQQVTASLTK